MIRSLFALLFALAASLAFAQSYPDYTEIYVNDFADLLPPEAEAEVRAKLTELKDKRGIEFTVVTLRSMQDHNHSGPIELFATGLFNSWGVGDAARNDGVMMLVARDDRVMRIEVGSGYGEQKNLRMKEIIENTILPEFRQDDYARGIDKGVDAVIYDLTGYWPGEYDMSQPQRAYSALQRFLDLLGAWAFALLAPFVPIGYALFRRFQRRRPRTCPVDGVRMRRIAETLDDNHLASGQRKEESLKSVDYDVWLCPTCGHKKIEAYKGWLSRYGACRKCGFRTVESDTTTLRSATRSSTGLQRVDYHCLNCGDRYDVEKVTPHITSSSSSSSGGSSFGGGSSSGGGASGSW